MPPSHSSSFVAGVGDDASGTSAAEPLTTHVSAQNAQSGGQLDIEVDRLMSLLS